MKLYDKYWASNYDELITYYPRYYADVFEMRAILEAHGALADGMEGDIERVYLNSFIDYADEATIEDLEEFLGIALNRSRTLEERRRLIKSFFVGFGKVSASMLEEMIASYTNGPVSSRFEPSDDAGNNTLYLDFERGDVETLYMGDVLFLLGKKIPAHINWQAAVTYMFPVGVGVRRSYYRFEYDFCGTKPEIAKIGALVTAGAAVEARRTYGTRNYPPSSADGLRSGESPEEAMMGRLRSAAAVTSERARSSSYTFEQTGQTPEVALQAALRAAAAATEARRTHNPTNYTPAEENGLRSGQTPSETLFGKSISREAVTEATASSHTVEHRSAADDAGAGMHPETAALADRNGISAGAAVKAESFGVDYIYCGTDVAHS